MIIPDNIHPKLSLYYNGAMILKLLKAKRKIELIKLYQELKNINNMITFPLFILTLDYLYLVNLAMMNKDGDIELCS